MKRPEKSKRNDPVDGTLDDGSFFSKKKNVVRLIFFLIAFLVAVFFISYGIYNMTNKRPGVYVIEAEYDYEVPVYSCGFTLEYMFDGSSNAIKETTIEVKNCYSSSLRWIYKLLDADNIYGSMNNVAMINKEAGKDVSVSDELFAILLDAWGKTRESQGYSVFSGPIRYFRDMLVYGYDPLERDPINDETIRNILLKCEEMIFSGKAAALYFDEAKKTVRLEIDPEFSGFLEQNGVDCPVLDLDLLRESYILTYTAGELEKHGYTRGRMLADSGLAVCPSGSDPIDFCFYSKIEDVTSVSATAEVGPGCAASYFRVFSLYDAEDGFYTFDLSGKTVFRHKYMSDFGTENILSGVLSVSEGYSLADLTYNNIKLMAKKKKQDVIDALGKSDILILLGFSDEPYAVCSSDEKGISINIQNGFYLKNE